jgi:hypothetical protein
VKDPQRLSDRADLPDDLQHALRGLGRNAPPADAVARIQRSLNALSVPPGPGGGSMIASSGFRAVALKATVVAVGSAAAVLFAVALRLSSPAAHSGQSDSTPPVAAAEERVQLAEAVSTPAAEETDPLQPPAVGHAETTQATHHRRSLRERAPQRRAPREPGSGAVSAATSHDVPSGLAGNAEPDPAQGASTVAAASDAHATEAQALDAHVAAAESLRALAKAPAPEDEASLLYRAKKLARTDRSAALRMLDQHATHFPKGTLVEEREVLAIDLLRGLGRKPEAEQRAAEFLQHFPASSYRRAVAR